MYIIDTPNSPPTKTTTTTQTVRVGLLTFASKVHFYRLPAPDRGEETPAVFVLGDVDDPFSALPPDQCVAGWGGGGGSVCLCIHTRMATDRFVAAPDPSNPHHTTPNLPPKQTN